MSIRNERAKAVILSPWGTDSQPIAKQIVNILHDLKVTPIYPEQISKPGSITTQVASEIDKADL